MIKDLSKDYQLRGYVLEYFARIILRREKKNNFIFMTSRFDDFSEIATKYRLKLPREFDSKLNLINLGWRKFDIIECSLDNVRNRRVLNLRFYDVKSKWHAVNRNYYEACTSNHDFMRSISESFETFIISIVLFENWRVSFSIVPYNSVPIRVYDSIRNKRVAFQRP